METCGILEEEEEEEEERERLRSHDPPLSPQLVTADSVPELLPAASMGGGAPRPRMMRDDDGDGDDGGDSAASVRDPSPPHLRAASSSPPPPPPSATTTAAAAAAGGVRVEKRPTSPATVSRPKGPDSPGGLNASARGGGGVGDGAAHAALPARTPGYVPPPGPFGGYKFNMNPFARGIYGRPWQD
ncbi:unnamed protein product, partial [Ectocarpus fasciculatus]